MKAANAILQFLWEQDIRTIFGYPGGMNLPLYDALYKEKRITHILTTDEQSAVYAADGYARATGKTGVCIATAGPGTMNMLAGIATAFTDFIPLVVIIGHADSPDFSLGAPQRTIALDFTPLTKCYIKVRSPRDVLPAIRKAFQTAKSGLPGPVLVDIAHGLFLTEINYKSAPGATVTKPAAPAKAVTYLDKAASLFSQARFPLIIAGSGVIATNSTTALLQFAEKTNCPVATTLLGIGAFPASHPLSLGFAGLHSHNVTHSTMRKADLIITIGSHLDDHRNDHIKEYIAAKQLIRIDADTTETAENIGTNIRLVGDIKAIMLLLSRHDPPPDLTQWWAYIHTLQEEADYPYQKDTLNVPWVMHYIAQKTRKGRYAFATDVGQHQLWAALHLTVDTPRTWFTSGGLGTMGYGLPAAIGAQVAFGKSRRVIHIAGDGGIKTTGNEYYTIASLNLPIISIIINNHALGTVRQIQATNYQGHYAACRLPEKMDFVAYGNCFGITSKQVTTAAEFAACFQEACASAKPYIIVVDVEPDVVGAEKK